MVPPDRRAEAPQPTSWLDRLNAPDRTLIESDMKVIFGGLFAAGYSIVGEVSQYSGRLLRGGSEDLVSHVRGAVAEEEFEARGTRDRSVGRSNKYAWRAGAFVPREDWETRSNLSYDDIRYEPAGVTIFAKPDTQE